MSTGVRTPITRNTAHDRIQPLSASVRRSARASARQRRGAENREEQDGRADVDAQGVRHEPQPIADRAAAHVGRRGRGLVADARELRAVGVHEMSVVERPPRAPPRPSVAMAIAPPALQRRPAAPPEQRGRRERRDEQDRERAGVRQVGDGERRTRAAPSSGDARARTPSAPAPPTATDCANALVRLPVVSTPRSSGIRW